jgi:hypothetical protein
MLTEPLAPDADDQPGALEDEHRVEIALEVQCEACVDPQSAV